MISTKGRYALRVMCDLAEREGSGPVPLKEISERQGISKKYLEIIVKDLVHHGLITGESGRGGGYRLSRPAEEYSTLEIIESTEGPLAAVACLRPDAKPCERIQNCRTISLWKEYDALTRNFFLQKKLSDLIRTSD